MLPPISPRSDPERCDHNPVHPSSPAAPAPLRSALTRASTLFRNGPTPLRLSSGGQGLMEGA